MGKSTGLFGSFVGKIGNIVGFKLANSNNNVTQGVRQYQPDVANPQSELQCIQRMKLAPANNFYRQLAEVLNNAWQGEKYGTRSRQYFMKLALKQTTGIPFCEKGDKRFYPGEYPVSEGSLPTQSVTAISGNLLATSIISGGVTGSWGEASQGFINKNFGVKNGDKLTFLFVGTNSNGEYIPAYSYVILDTDSEEDAADVLASSNLSFAGAADAALQVGIENAVSTIVAGAVIVSRLDTTTSAAWQRSSSSMFCTTDYKNVMMSTSAYETALASYASSKTYTSSWYLNKGLTGFDVLDISGGSSNVSVTSIDNVSLVVSEMANAASIAVFTMSDGSKRVARASIGGTFRFVRQSGSSFAEVEFTYPSLSPEDGIVASATALTYLQANNGDTGTSITAYRDVTL